MTQPFIYSGFRFEDKGLTPVGEPTQEEWMECLKALKPMVDRAIDELWPRRLSRDECVQLLGEILAQRAPSLLQFVRDDGVAPLTEQQRAGIDCAVVEAWFEETGGFDRDMSVEAEQTDRAHEIDYLLITFRSGGLAQEV